MDSRPAGRKARRASPAGQGLGRFVLLASVAGLTLFHGVLLWQRIASSTLLDPLVALRWGAAALILAGFFQVQRSGVSLLRGHRAVILWLLVLLLHAGAAGTPQPLATPELLLAASLWGLALPALLSGLGRRLATPGEARRIASRRPGVPVAARFLAPLSPRPPPVDP